MENDDKPFMCTAPNCGLKFANSDHLVVHQQKHQLSLNIGLRQSDALIDQTPTPTRFLPKTSEGGELFEGLPESNPFDQDFNKAAALSTSASSNVPVPQITVSAPETATKTISIGKPKMVKNQLVQSKAKPTIPIQLQNIKILNSDSEFVKKLGSSGLTVLVGPQTITQKNQKGTTPGRPTALAISGPNSNSNLTLTVNQGSAAGVMPIIGIQPQQTNPAVRSAVPHPAIVATSMMVTNGNEANKTTLAKQKLKEILQQNVNLAAAANGVIQGNLASSMQQHYNGGGGGSGGGGYTNSSSSPNSSLNSPDNSEMMDDEYDLDMQGAPIKRSRRSQDESDPDERRKRFLERNRAAASRCRQKRKVWVQQLEKKADDLSATNSGLQGEINLLRTEVAQLKALLLAHKDCPVTMQQQKILIDHSSAVYSQASDSHMMSMSPMSNQHRIETAEEVASTALTDMANQHQLEPRDNRHVSCISVISDGNLTTMNNNVNEC